MPFRQRIETLARERQKELLQELAAQNMCFDQTSMAALKQMPCSEGVKLLEEAVGKDRLSNPSAWLTKAARNFMIAFRQTKAAGAQEGGGGADAFPKGAAPSFLSKAQSPAPLEPKSAPWPKPPPKAAPEPPPQPPAPAPPRPPAAAAPLLVPKAAQAGPPQRAPLVPRARAALQAKQPEATPPAEPARAASRRPPPPPPPPPRRAVGAPETSSEVAGLAVPGLAAPLAAATAPMATTHVRAPAPPALAPLAPAMALPAPAMALPPQTAPGAAPAGPWWSSPAVGLQQPGLPEVPHQLENAGIPAGSVSGWEALEAATAKSVCVCTVSATSLRARTYGRHWFAGERNGRKCPEAAINENIASSSGDGAIAVQMRSGWGFSFQIMGARQARDAANAFGSIKTAKLKQKVMRQLGERRIATTFDSAQWARVALVGEAGNIWLMKEGCAPGCPIMVLLFALARARGIESRALIERPLIEVAPPWAGHQEQATVALPFGNGQGAEMQCQGQNGAIEDLPMCVGLGPNSGMQEAAVAAMFSMAVDASYMFQYSECGAEFNGQSEISVFERFAVDDVAAGGGSIGSTINLQATVKLASVGVSQRLGQSLGQEATVTAASDGWPRAGQAPGRLDSMARRDIRHRALIYSRGSSRATSWMIGEPLESAEAAKPN
ncbi:unnamed protein product [Prorocentrum cordatum]|uniref:Uncharacterized protein n=1 Tax=Prorocentrum cordatum TaxID=2364126 RepID=A0ABN9TZG8_9DINO|nr:unnamed protein product [Polarella glacialis]